MNGTDGADSGMSVAAPWLKDAWTQVQSMLPRLPHALLIHGPAGWGQERIANALAATIIGRSADDDAREIAHPDLRWLEPEDGVIKIDAVRQTIGFLMQTPTEAGRKVAVVQGADRMNINAANALLKTLEEPPAESFLALCSGAAERLPATVRSRCQRIGVRPAAAAGVRDWLAAAGVSGDAADYWAVEFGSAPFAILDAASNNRAPLWPALAEAGRTPAALAQVADAQREEDLADLMGRWLRIVHWLLRRAAPQDAAAILGFASELVAMRRVALLNSALNRPMQMQRLLLMWSEIWPRLPAAEPRLPA